MTISFPDDKKVVEVIWLPSARDMNAQSRDAARHVISQHTSESDAVRFYRQMQHRMMGQHGVEPEFVRSPNGRETHMVAFTKDWALVQHRYDALWRTKGDLDERGEPQAFGRLVCVPTIFSEQDYRERALSMEKTVPQPTAILVGMFAPAPPLPARSRGQRPALMPQGS
ncbi:MAG: hypothetical protein KBA75_04065 [Alphaproteobacteria bacterium]|nr:hypothetical protein [Alphaproteobacteria bacterium]